MHSKGSNGDLLSLDSADRYLSDIFDGSGMLGEILFSVPRDSIPQCSQQPHFDSNGLIQCVTELDAANIMFVPMT